MSSEPGRRVYLDSASGVPLHPAAREAFAAALDAAYADPRRLHHAGRAARLVLDNARAATAEALGVRPEEVTFTASGTEAVHRGLLGLHRGAARRGAQIVHTAVEHSAVLHAAEWSGAPTRSIAVEPTGRVRLDDLGAVDLTDTSVVACQSANHEVGTLQPIAEVAGLLGGVPLFVDACASAGRLALPEGWSALAASAHKWGGPPGVGVLVVRRGARWRDPFPDDERNVPAILASAAALQAVVAERETENLRHHSLIGWIRGVVGELEGVEVVGDPSDRLPHLVTFSCLYVDGEALVTELDRLGFEVASGSACTASTLEPSHVLAAMGALTHGNVRLSLGRDTDEEDVGRFLEVLPGAIERLRARL
ncbi:MAG TPA: aminotransferase class V-fold PLP-dependent enzyme [Nocardioides sp.]|uniref:cysteine desulfurase family protein n=1 Tax=Nocardioides sp. TaxID=35761 RepID=UPI002F3E8773